MLDYLAATAGAAHIWFVPLRITVGPAPAHKPKGPSCLMIFAAQSMGPCA